MRNRRKVRYCRISNIEIRAPVIEGMLNKLVAKLAITPAAADTKNNPATMGLFFGLAYIGHQPL